MKSKFTFSNITITGIILIMVVVSSNLNWGGDHWKSIIEADAKGYYAYLPAIFIYHDLNFGFFDKIEKEKYYDENMYYDYRAGANGKVIDKYYCGTALALTPFFLTAHLLSHAQHTDSDGYSKLYAVFVSVAALFYLLVGFIFLNLTLKTYDINEWQRSLTLFAAVFGTNLFYYAVGEPGMSHVFSFAFISMFFYYSQRYFSTFHKKYILYLSALLGIIVLIRPVNGLIVFACPFTAGSFNSLKKGILEAFRHKWSLVMAAILFLGILSLQLIIYKISTGKFFVYSYGQEGFNFLSPHIIDILFSYKKGLFLYTPLFLLSLTGGYFLWKSSRFEFYTWFGFFVLITYVLSSWWMWFYGGSFSSRVYVEYIPLFMILLALLLKGIKRKPLKTAYITIIVLLIIVCQIQTYQYRYYQIHWSDMTKEKYWNNFLRIDKLMK